MICTMMKMLKNSKNNKKITGLESIIINIGLVFCFMFMIAIAILGILSVFNIINPYTQGMVTVFCMIFIIITELIIKIIQIYNRIN